MISEKFLFLLFIVKPMTNIVTKLLATIILIIASNLDTTAQSLWDLVSNAKSSIRRTWENVVF